MLAFAYAGRSSSARWQQAGRVRERQASKQRRDRPVGAHRFNNQERNRYNHARAPPNPPLTQAQKVREEQKSEKTSRRRGGSGTGLDPPRLSTE